MPVEEAWQLLEGAGISIAYSEEACNKIKLFVYLSSTKLLQAFPWIDNYEIYQLPEINWEEQWRIHGLNFQDGRIHVDLEQFGGPQVVLHLESGPGFGDLSHPTTRLILKLMAKYLKEQSLIDIGCGSGILSLAGTAMGSCKAYGVDIDVQAISHSEKNAKINHMQKKCHFCLSKNFYLPEFPAGWLIVMNMIHFEQIEAWESLSALHSLTGGLILTSGIMKEDRTQYLRRTSAWGWHPEEEIEDSGWLAFCFSPKNAA